MGVVVGSNRKKLLITLFILFTILYWALFFPLLWIHTKPRVKAFLWITILIAAVLLFIVLALITRYLVKKYNWWINLVTRDSEPEYDYGFQAALHRYPSEEWCIRPKPAIQRHHEVIELTPQRKIPATRAIPTPKASPQVPQVFVDKRVLHEKETPQRKFPASRPSSTPKASPEICEVFVDKRILLDKETQTAEGSLTPALYRTSLIMDVHPRTPSSAGSDSQRNSWFYPTLADYYKDKTLKLRVRLDKAQQEQSKLEHQESQILHRSFSSPQPEEQDSQQHPQVMDYSISDTSLFLKREQVYTNLEIR